jgi:thiol-disulfide isomerase/thioredoxin
VFQDKVKNRQQYLDSAFLSNFKAESETIWQIPNGIELMDFYCIYSADADHKKVSERSKRVLDIFAVKNPAIYKYYFNYLMNSFPRMSKYYYELATNTLYYDYIEKGKADFFNENELLKIKNYVANFERLKVGNQVSDLRLYKEDKSPYNVFDSKSPYTLLMIWSPDCGHCKKELPILKRKYLEYKNKGIQVLTLSTKRGEKVKEGYDYLKTQNIPDEWINLNDAEGRSNFNSIYDVSSFPLIYLLDKDKKILLKRRGEMEEAEIDILFKNLN